MGEARAYRGDKFAFGDTIGATNGSSRRTQGLGGAAAFAAHDSGDANLKGRLVDGFNRSAISVTLPGPNTDCVSHGPSGRTRAGLTQQCGHIVMPASLGCFQRRARTALGNVEIGP